MYVEIFIQVSLEIQILLAIYYNRNTKCGEGYEIILEGYIVC